MAADDDHSTGPREPRHRLRQRFEVIRKLGHGTYGKVQLAINKETGQEVAIKTIKKAKIENGQDLIRIRREIQIMSYVQHPHIIHIHEVFENKEKIVLVMQYASGGELYDYLKTRKGISEADSRRIFRQIVSAVYYCHKNKICHRDLKLENILLDEKGNAKIADFGLSNVFSDDKFLHTFCGSPLYASPEIVKGKPYYGPEVDCWSLGVLLYTLIYGAMPFDGSNFRSLVRQISEGEYYEPKRKSDASGLIQHLLTVKPSKRATVADICDHWWVNLGYEHPLSQVAEDMANFSPINVDALLNLPQTNRSEQCKSPQKQYSRNRNSPTCGQSGFLQESSECKPAKKASKYLNTNYDVVNSDSVSCSDDSIVVNSIGSSKDVDLESNNFPTDILHLVPDKNAISKMAAKIPNKQLSENNQDNKKHVSEPEFIAQSRRSFESAAEEFVNSVEVVATYKNSYSPEIMNKYGVIRNKQEIIDGTTRQDNRSRGKTLRKNEEVAITGDKSELFQLRDQTEKLNSQQQVKNEPSESTISELFCDEKINHNDTQISEKTAPSEEKFMSLNKNYEISESNENIVTVRIHLKKSKPGEESLTQHPMMGNYTKAESKTSEVSYQRNEHDIEKINLSSDKPLSSVKNDKVLLSSKMPESITSKVSDKSMSTYENKPILDEEKSAKQTAIKSENKTADKDAQDCKKPPNKKGPGKLVIPKFFEAQQTIEKSVDNKKVNKPLWSISDAKKAFENKPQEKKPVYIPTRRVSDARSKFEQKIESNQVSTLPRRASRHSNVLKEDLSSCSLSSLKGEQRHGSELNGSSLKDASELNVSKPSCTTKNSCEESNIHQIPKKESRAEIEISDDKIKKTSANPDLNDINTVEEIKITAAKPSINLPSTSSFNEDKISGSQNRTDISEIEAVETIIKVSSNSVDLESAPLTQNSNPTIVPSQQNFSFEEIKQVVCQNNSVIDAITEQQHKCNPHEGTTSNSEAFPCDNKETHERITNGHGTLSQPLQKIKLTSSNSISDEYGPDVCSKEKTTLNRYPKEGTEKNRIDDNQTMCNDSGNCSDNEVGTSSKARSINNQSSGYISENHSSFGGEEQDVKESFPNEGTKLELLKTFMEKECFPLNALLQNGCDHPHGMPHQGHKQLLSSNTASQYSDIELGINNLPLQNKRSHHSRRRHSDAPSFLKPSSNETTFGLRDISDLPESCYDDMLKLLNSQNQNKCSASSVISKHRHSRHTASKDHQARIQQWFKSEQRNGHSTDRDSSDNDDDFDIHLDYSYPASNAYQNMNVIEDTLAPAQCSTPSPNTQRPVTHTGYRSIDEFTSIGNYKDSFLSSEEIQNVIGIPSSNMNYIRRHSHAMRYKDPYLADITSRYIQNPMLHSFFPGYHHSNTILREQLKVRPNAAELYGTLRRSSCKAGVLELPEQRDSLYPSNSICRKSLYGRQNTSFGRNISNTERLRQNYARSLSLDIPDIPHHSGRVETSLQPHIPQNFTTDLVQKQNFDNMHFEQDIAPNICANNTSNHGHCNINIVPTHQSGGETKINKDIMQCEINKLEADKKDACSAIKISECGEPLFKSEHSLLQHNTLEKTDENVGCISDRNVNTCDRNLENDISLPLMQTKPTAIKAPSVSLLEALKMQGYKNVIAQNLNFGSGSSRSSISERFRSMEEQDCLKGLQNCKEQENFVEQRNTNDTICPSTEHLNLAFSANQFPQYENLALQQINGKQQLATVQESNESLSCKFDSDQEESVSDRIWRKSFYSRFNDSHSKRRRSCREGDLKAQSVSSSSWDILIEDNFKEDILSRRRSSLNLGSSYASTLPRSGIKAITKHHSYSETSDPLLHINDSSMIHKNSYRQKCNKNNRSLSLEMVESISEDSSSFPIQRSAHSIVPDRDSLYTTSVAENPYNRRYGTIKSAYSNNNRQILSQLRGEEDCHSGTRTVGILPRRRYSTFDGYLFMQKTLPEPVISFLDSTNAENDELS